MITYVPDNLWGEMLPFIDNTQLMKDCLDAEEVLMSCDLVKDSEDTGVYGNRTSASYINYNLLSLPIESFQSFYHNLISVIKPCLPKEHHVIQCWFNVFRGGEFVGWHDHWPARYRCVHGFYCVNVTPSFTEYKYKHIPDQVFKIKSKEGLLVFGKSNNDLHQSSPWSDSANPRITIAFDILPVSTMVNNIRPNHYLPF
jgi:hypothetical protein